MGKSVSFNLPPCGALENSAGQSAFWESRWGRCFRTMSNRWGNNKQASPLAVRRPLWRSNHVIPGLKSAELINLSRHQLLYEGCKSEMKRKMLKKVQINQEKKPTAHIFQSFTAPPCLPWELTSWPGILKHYKVHVSLNEPSSKKKKRIILSN